MDSGFRGEKSGLEALAARILDFRGGGKDLGLGGGSGCRGEGFGLAWGFGLSWRNSGFCGEDFRED